MARPLWRYIRTEHSEEHWETCFNDMGYAGWELVSVVHGGKGVIGYFKGDEAPYFKREWEEKKEREKREREEREKG
tara:strand:+ start:261 stop:488 length:228 start_codon:yes stop_codon:yes gene_type:complete